MSRLTELLFPGVCPGCGVLTDFRAFGAPGSDVFCPSCRDAWDAAEQVRCGICSMPVSECACMPDPMRRAKFTGFCKLIFYRPGKRDHVGSRVLYRIKDRADAPTIRYLASEMAETVKKASEQLEFPMENLFVSYLPRGRRALLDSGRDQARLLAAALAERLGAPCYRVIARRFWHSKQQKTLSLADRRRNARASFRLRDEKRASGRNAILVDDLVTSGAGMEAASRLLRRAGVKKLLAVAVATDECNRYPPARDPDLSGAHGDPRRR